MATYLQMLNSVYAVLRDTERVYVLEEQIEEWLNEAYLDICVRYGYLTEETVTATTSATGTIAVPAGFVRLLTLYLDTDIDTEDEIVEFVKDDIFLAWESSGVEPGHTIARIFKDVVETWPQAQSVGYTLEYLEKPTALALATDVPVLPEELHSRIVNYARAHGKWVEGELSEGNIYWALYSENLPPAPTARERKSPGPVTMTPVIGYWEQ